MDNHISQEDILAFMQDRMKQADKEAFLAHIGTCNYCSQQFATLMSTDLIPAPKSMKENLLKASKRPEVQLAARAKETSQKMQLFLYSLKVGTATIGALLLLLLTMNFSGTINQINIPTDFVLENEEKLFFTGTLRDNMNIISNHMLDFSNNIMKTEVNDNDQKEK